MLALIYISSLLCRCGSDNSLNENSKLLDDLRDQPTTSAFDAYLGNGTVIVAGEINTQGLSFRAITPPGFVSTKTTATAVGNFDLDLEIEGLVDQIRLDELGFDLSRIGI